MEGSFVLLEHLTRLAELVREDMVEAGGGVLYFCDRLLLGCLLGHVGRAGEMKVMGERKKEMSEEGTCSFWRSKLKMCASAGVTYPYSWAECARFGTLGRSVPGGPGPAMSAGAYRTPLLSVLLFLL